MTINDYVSGSRKTISNTDASVTDAIAAKIYHKLFDWLKSGLEQDLSHIALDIAYSTNKTAETVFDLEGKAYLIYDRYLGQCFSMLTRLFFNSSEIKEAESYSFKLLAEELQIAGYLQEAQLCAGAYALQIGESSTYKEEKDGNRRNNYILIQEGFVIAHELAHFVLYINKDTKLLSTIRDSMTLLFQDDLMEPISDEDVDAYLQDIHRLSYDTNTSYKEYLDDEQIANIKADLQNNRDNQSKEFAEFIQQDDRLIEEIYCDDLALQLLLNILPVKLSVDCSIIIDAVYLGMMNLRILGMINHIVLDLMQEKAESEYFIRTSMIRLIRYRDKATYFYSEMYNAGTSQKTHQMLTMTNVRYSQMVSDPINFLAPEKLQRTKELSKYLPEIIHSDFIAVNERIDAALNH